MQHGRRVDWGHPISLQMDNASATRAAGRRVAGRTGGGSGSWPDASGGDGRWVPTVRGTIPRQLGLSVSAGPAASPALDAPFLGRGGKRQSECRHRPIPVARSDTRRPTGDGKTTKTLKSSGELSRSPSPSFPEIAMMMRRGAAGGQALTWRAWPAPCATSGASLKAAAHARAHFRSLSQKAVAPRSSKQGRGIRRAGRMAGGRRFGR